MIDGLFQQGSFFGLDANATPEMVERKRRLMQMLAPQYGKAKYVGEGLGQLATGIVAGRQNRELDRVEGEGRKGATDLFNRVIGAAGGGSAAPASTPFLPQPTAQPTPQAAQQPAPQGDMAAYVRAGLIQRGLPEHVADGFVTNFNDESRLNPGINEIEPLVAGSRGGFGLSQWTGPRRRELEAFAQQQGKPVSDTDLQLDFLMHELQGSESNAAQSILSSKDSSGAAVAILNKFLRPSEEHRARRERRYLGQSQPQQTQAQSGPTTADLQAALANPWLGASQKAQLQGMLAQRQQDADPLRNLQIERAQLQNEALRNPTPDQTATQQDYNLARNQGFEGSFLDYQTALAQAKRPQNNVTVDNGGDKFAEEFAKGDAKALASISESGVAASRNLSRINQLEGLLAESPTGFAGAVTRAAGEWGINTEGLGEVQAAQALINSMVPEQRQPGSGPMSDADLALFKQSLPRIINQKGGNEAIIATMRNIAQYDAQGAQIVQDLRSGKITRAEAFTALQSRDDPMAGFKSGTGSPAPTSAGLPPVPSGIAPEEWEKIFNDMPPEDQELFK